MLIFIFITIALIIAVILIVAMVMPKTTIITSQTQIDCPRDKVFNYIKFLGNQKNYNKWVMADPNVKMTYTGTDGTVGFTSAWLSQDSSVGQGEQEIIKIYEGEGYEAELRFEKPFKGISYSKTMIETIDSNKSLVTTTFTSNAPFPMNLLSYFMKDMLLKDMNENGANLKKILEG